VGWHQDGRQPAGDPQREGHAGRGCVRGRGQRRVRVQRYVRVIGGAASVSFVSGAGACTWPVEMKGLVHSDTSAHLT
jgi:hypothetical protein